MLTVIAKDLNTPQGGAEQSEKSKGNAPEVDGKEKTAAEQHGADPRLWYTIAVLRFRRTS
jgi:hypothetical protein